MSYPALKQLLSGKSYKDIADLYHPDKRLGRFGWPKTPEKAEEMTEDEIRGLREKVIRAVLARAEEGDANAIRLLEERLGGSLVVRFDSPSPYDD